VRSNVVPEENELNQFVTVVGWQLGEMISQDAGVLSRVTGVARYRVKTAVRACAGDVSLYIYMRNADVTRIKTTDNKAPTKPLRR